MEVFDPIFDHLNQAEGEQDDDEPVSEDNEEQSLSNGEEPEQEEDSDSDYTYSGTGIEASRADITALSSQVTSDKDRLQISSTQW